MKKINEEIFESEIDKAFKHIEKTLAIREQSKELEIPIWFNGHIFYE